MRLPRVRFTTRTTMVVVAIVAILLGAARLRGLSVTYWHRAEFYRLAGQMHDHGPDSVEAREQIPKIHAYFDMMQAKYTRASRYPWLPVAPDPTIPW